MFIYYRQSGNKHKEVLLAVLFPVEVFGIWHPAPHGEQALHHESRRVRLRHSQHLPRYHLHLLLLSPNLWNKTRVNHHPIFLTYRQGMHHYGNLGIHDKSLLTSLKQLTMLTKQLYLFIYLPDYLFICLILIRSWIFCEFLVQLYMYIDVRQYSHPKCQ